MESDAGGRQEQPPILYETLSPLSLSPTPSPPSPTQQPSSNGDYIVLRSDVISSNPLVPPVELPAADYFSLDVNDDLDYEQYNDRTPSPAPCPPGDSETVQKAALESSWFRGSCRFKSPMLQLHKEVLDFCDFLSPTIEEQAARDVAVESVSDVIKYIWPNCEVEVFGSFKTGLYLPTSDIDVVILESDVTNTQQALYALSRALSQRGIAKKIQVIAKARVPIIKFVEKQSGVSFDISFDVENGPKAAEFIKVAISKLPPLRPLCLILKVFLQQRELNEVYSGGIGSYALLAMLIAMLQSLRECNASPEQNLGILLINFFDVYGRKLNTSDVGVSCHGAGTFFLKKSRGFLNKGRPHLLSIEDPQAPDNDIGKNSFNYFQIKSAFAMAFSTLTNAKIILGLGPDRSILGTIIRPDPVLLERKGGSNGDVTFSSLLPGSGELIPIPYGDQQMFCNWQLDDAEEPFQRGNSASENHNNGNSSRKKRKASESATKESGRSPKARSEENGFKKDRTGKKKRWRHSKRDRVAV